MATAPTIPLTDIYFPGIGLATALHRRSNEFFIVFPRAYGMANGNKFVAQLNYPPPKEAAPDLPSSYPHLNPRIWLRDGREWDGGNGMMTFQELMDAEPKVFKDSGLRRKVKVKEAGGKAEKEIEERLVEVLFKEEEYCQRCAWCGGWEYSYEGSTRHRKAGDGKDGRPVYWCGDCSRMPKPLSRYWWQDPEKLDDSVYFFCKLP